MTEILRRKGSDIQTKTSALQLVNEQNGWFLCSDAEERARRALEKDMLVLVNNNLLVKMMGKMTAICTESVITPSGDMFDSGYWYSPCDMGGRKTIEEGFNRGFMRIDLTNGQWIKMRQVADDEVLEKAVVRAQTLSLRYIGNMSLGERKQLRRAEREPFMASGLDLGTGN